MGGFSEFLGVRSVVARRLRAQSRQLVELQSVAWGVRLATRPGYATVTLVSDSDVAHALILQVRAKNVLSAQQSVLRGLTRRLVCSGLVVRILRVPCGFQPADPMSWLQGEFAAIAFGLSAWRGLCMNSCCAVLIRWSSVRSCASLGTR